MKLENNNIKISIFKQMTEVVENVFTLTVRVLTQTAEFFFPFLITTTYLCKFINVRSLMRATSLLTRASERSRLDRMEKNFTSLERAL